MAIQNLSTPVASPYAVSFYTLPTHWRFMDQVHQATFGNNVLPDGDFELGPERIPHAWSPQEVTIDKVVMESRRVDVQPKEGRRCLMLKITPQNAEAPPQALERTFLAINTPAVHLPPGSLVQISGWLKIPAPIKASPDGALFYDSAGGEPLGVRLAGATAWRKFTLYRRVPDSGLVSVTLALTAKRGGRSGRRTKFGKCRCSRCGGAIATLARGLRAYPFVRRSAGQDRINSSHQCGTEGNRMGVSIVTFASSRLGEPGCVSAGRTRGANATPLADVRN